MEHLIYTGPTGVTATLTTESPASSYGIPVLRVEGPDVPTTDYGPGDFLPSGIAAGALVATGEILNALPADAREAARLYLSQWPDGVEDEL